MPAALRLRDIPVMGHDGHIVSVVVPTTGRDTIASCREALSVQTRPPDEVVVVTDEDRRGPGWARNEGIRRSRGDLIAFTDDDCVPPPDWLERLIRAIDRYDAAGSGGTFRETDPLLMAKRLRRKIPDTEQVDTAGWVGNTGNVMYRRSWIEECLARDGFVFNESFTAFSGEDQELSWRMRRRGASFVFVPNTVTHLRRVTPSEYFLHQFDRGKGIAHLFLSHRSARASMAPQKSLLWEEAGGGRARKWWNLLRLKAIGPFDVGSFRCARDFAVFWIGEKCEGAGFVWEILARWRDRSRGG